MSKRVGGSNSLQSSFESDCDTLFSFGGNIEGPHFFGEHRRLAVSTATYGVACVPPPALVPMDVDDSERCKPTLPMLRTFGPCNDR